MIYQHESQFPNFQSTKTAIQNGKAKNYKPTEEYRRGKRIRHILDQEVSTTYGDPQELTPETATRVKNVLRESTAKEGETQDSYYTSRLHGPGAAAQDLLGDPSIRTLFPIL